MYNTQKCKECSAAFIRYNTIQSVCVKCAIKLAKKSRIEKQKTQKIERKADRLRLKALRPLSWYRKKMIHAFNAFIRYRDRDLPCISCEKPTANVWHSGHYLTTKARPWLAVHPANAHKQCYACNVPLSGNISQYRPRLIAKMGVEMVEYLENCHSDYILTVDDINEITQHYKDELERCAE